MSRSCPIVLAATLLAVFAVAGTAWAQAQESELKTSGEHWPAWLSASASPCERDKLTPRLRKEFDTLLVSHQTRILILGRDLYTRQLEFDALQDLNDQDERLPGLLEEMTGLRHSMQQEDALFTTTVKTRFGLDLSNSGQCAAH